MDPALELEIAALSRQKAMNEALKQGDSDIQKFYANTTVFLTGGTGFLGKNLIEKLLRSCKILKMYLLIRSKKGKTVKERLEEMLEDPVFSILHKSQPEFSSRLVCVEGDVSEIRLGLSERDWQMLADQVEVIFHCAATTRFDEKLRTVTRINVRGTREALLLARAAGRLKSFIHVSTAYSHATTECEGQEVQESFYPTPIPPETLIHLVDETDEQRLVAITPELIKNWPNTYTFCKAVAEEAVRTMSEGLPISIIRPGVVITSYYEPTPGWTDESTIYGATGLMVGAVLGVLHVILSDHKVRVALVPCDYVTNAVIEMVSRALNYDCRHRIPSPFAVYYNYGLETSSIRLFKIFSMFVHLIPAYILDAICFVFRRDRLFIKLSKKVERIIISLSYFSLHEWIFLDNNTEKLYKNLSRKDQLIFNFDITNINWTEFFMIWVIGVRKYIIKDDLKSTNKAIRNQFWFKLLHYLLTCVYFYVLWQVFVSFYNFGRYFMSLIF